MSPHFPNTINDYDRRDSLEEKAKWLRVAIVMGSALAAATISSRSEASEPGLHSVQAVPTPQRDGQHDFDFDIGTWKTHVSRLQHPLTGSKAWVELDGTTVVRKVWNGRANLAELEADGTTGHLEILSLRLYDPKSHQWSFYTASSKGGSLSVPTIGKFNSAGYGEFFDAESLNGRSILVRNVWSEITANSCRFEQAFSDDGGKTWETNWIAVDTRVNAESTSTN